MVRTEISSTDDIISVQDIADRIDELRDELESADIPANEFGGPNDTMSDEREECAKLESLMSDMQGYGGDVKWEGEWYPGEMIRESYFKDYAQQLAEDIGAIDSDAKWPNTCIDWDQAARELRMDYTGVEFDGTTYYVR